MSSHHFHLHHLLISSNLLVRLNVQRPDKVCHPMWTGFHWPDQSTLIEQVQGLLRHGDHGRCLSGTRRGDGRCRNSIQNGGPQECCNFPRETGISLAEQSQLCHGLKWIRIQVKIKKKKTLYRIGHVNMPHKSMHDTCRLIHVKIYLLVRQLNIQARLLYNLRKLQCRHLMKMLHEIRAFRHQRSTLVAHCGQHPHKTLKN